MLFCDEEFGGETNINYVTIDCMKKMKSREAPSEDLSGGSGGDASLLRHSFMKAPLGNWVRSGVRIVNVAGDVFTLFSSPLVIHRLFAGDVAVTELLPVRILPHHTLDLLNLFKEALPDIGSVHAARTALEIYLLVNFSISFLRLFYLAYKREMPPSFVEYPKVIGKAAQDGYCRVVYALRNPNRRYF